MDGKQIIHLLDSRGCPTDPVLFPLMEKHQTIDFINLHARFSVFKFIETPFIEFYITISFCDYKCPVIVCNLESKTTLNDHHKRFEKVTYEKIPKYTIINETLLKQSIELNADIKDNAVRNQKYIQKVFVQYNFSDKLIQDDSLYWANKFKSNSEIKLKFQLFVGEPKKNTITIKSYNVNNSRIFVALSDTDNVVILDFSLMVGILIFWFLINIIIILIFCRFAKSNKFQSESYYSSTCLDQYNHTSEFDSLENRGRIHWAVPCNRL